jgi:hypothetical protein
MILKKELKIRKEQNTLITTKKTNTIRMVVTTKVEKYKGFQKDGIGISAADFVDWVQNEPLNEEEIEYCMSATTDKDIRTILIHKKQDILR